VSQDQRDTDALRRLLAVVAERNLDPFEVGAEIVRHVRTHPDMTTEQIADAITAGVTAPN
jgi:hypothetical protein